MNRGDSDCTRGHIFYQWSGKNSNCPSGRQRRTQGETVTDHERGLGSFCLKFIFLFIRTGLSHSPSGGPRPFVCKAFPQSAFKLQNEDEDEAEGGEDSGAVMGRQCSLNGPHLQYYQWLQACAHTGIFTSAHIFRLQPGRSWKPQTLHPVKSSLYISLHLITITL